MIANRQQIVRLDHEDLHPLGEAMEQALLDAAAQAIAACEIVVLSDYGKGLFGERTLRAVLDSPRPPASLWLSIPSARNFRPIAAPIS